MREELKEKLDVLKAVQESSLESTKQAFYEILGCVALVLIAIGGFLGLIAGFIYLVVRIVG